MTVFTFVRKQIHSTLLQMRGNEDQTGKGQTQKAENTATLQTFLSDGSLNPPSGHPELAKQLRLSSLLTQMQVSVFTKPPRGWETLEFRALPVILPVKIQVNMAQKRGGLSPGSSACQASKIPYFQSGHTSLLG